MSTVPKVGGPSKASKGSKSPEVKVNFKSADSEWMIKNGFKGCINFGDYPIDESIEVPVTPP